MSSEPVIVGIYGESQPGTGLSDDIDAGVVTDDKAGAAAAADQGCLLYTSPSPRD